MNNLLRLNHWEQNEKRTVLVMTVLIGMVVIVALVIIAVIVMTICIVTLIVATVGPPSLHFCLQYHDGEQACDEVICSAVSLRRRSVRTHVVVLVKTSSVRVCP